MLEWIQQIFTECCKIASSEGIRFIRTQALAAYVRVVQVIRYIFMLHYVNTVLCFINGLSFFVGLGLVSMWIFDSTQFDLTVPVVYCTTLFVISSLILAYALREKTWMQIFRIEEFVDSVDSRGSSDLNADDIERIVEKVLEEKLRSRSKHESKHS